MNVHKAIVAGVDAFYSEHKTICNQPNPIVTQHMAEHVAAAIYPVVEVPTEAGPYLFTPWDGKEWLAVQVEVESMGPRLMALWEDGWVLVTDLTGEWRQIPTP